MQYGNLYAVDLINKSVGMTLFCSESLDEAKYQLAKHLEKAVAEEYNLTSYEDWKKWLCESKPENYGYNDNWCFAEHTPTTQLDVKTFDAFNTKWTLKKSTYQHKLCPKQYTFWEIYNGKDLYPVALCGFTYSKAVKA